MFLDKKTFFLFFKASWCKNCKKVFPVLENFSQKKNISLILADIDDFPDLAFKKGVASVPTLMYIKNGKETFTYCGSLPVVLEQKLSKIIAND
ncbi:hypothetical protein MHBO_001708 [Bonamia ostreae]